jgi:hypothetical protein
MVRIKGNVSHNRSQVRSNVDLFQNKLETVLFSHLIPREEDIKYTGCCNIEHRGLKRDMETNRIFRGFCINRFGIGSVHYISHYISSRSDFGFELRYLYSKHDSPTQRYGESATLRIIDTQSWRLSDATIRGVDDSPHH